jgi:drug/metabolite transporter (DMT)-like permease
LRLSVLGLHGYCAAMSHRAAVLLLMFVAFLWSLGGVLIKSVEWHPLAIAGTRSAIASVLLWVWLRRPQFTWSKVQLGIVVSYVATVCLFVVANRLTTAVNAIFLQYTAPIYVAIGGPLFLGERARPADWICVLLALAGIALFLNDRFTPSEGWGIAAALGSGLSFAAMLIFLRKERKDSPLSALLLGNLATAVIASPFMFRDVPPLGDWGPLIGLGLFQLGLPYLLYGLAIQRVKAVEAIFILMLEPLLNPLWVYVVRGEVPGPWSLAGAGMILLAVLLRALGKSDEVDGQAKAR